jgi:uncharacterized protein (TIGR03084 family)
MAVEFGALLADLTAEGRVVEEMVSPLGDDGWELSTPAEGWAVRDQVSHLAYFDAAAVLAIADGQRFREELAAVLAHGPAFPDHIAARHRGLSPDKLLEWFSAGRRALLDTYAATDPALRVPWYGPDMSVASSVTARLMETWAHGQDIADALGTTREPTARLRHIAHLGVRTMAFSFGLHGRAAPQTPVRVELSAPDGSVWSWGPADSVDRVSGTALDFCLAVTQRRHRADTGLIISGPVAAEWMSIAQAFAGTPGPGRPPGVAARTSGRDERPLPPRRSA